MDEMNAALFRAMRRQVVFRNPVDFDAALIGLVQPGEDLDQRRFSRAILADQPVHRAGPDLQRGT